MSEANQDDIPDSIKRRNASFVKNVLVHGEPNAHHYWSWLNSNTYLRRVMRAMFELRQRSKKNKLSYGKVAKALGCSKTQVHDFFSGRHRKPLSDQKIISFCELLEIDVSIKVDVKGK